MKAKFFPPFFPFFLFFFFPFFLTAQNRKPIHQVELESHKNYLPKIECTSEEIKLGKIYQTSKVAKTVFGYLPSWENNEETYKNLRYDLLTHIAVFSFEADGSGNLNTPQKWPWSKVINDARTNKVKLIMCVTNFNPDEIHNLLVIAEIRNKLFENIRLKLAEFNFDGVNIDFENLRDGDKTINIKNFMSTLKNFLLQLNPNYEVSFATPAVGYGKWDFKGIAESCDYLFVMGYDFYGSWSITTGPSSPLNHITKSFQEDYKDIAATAPNKLILGVPYYGNYWRTKSKEAYTSVDTSKANRDWQKPIYYRELFPGYIQKEKIWDDKSQTTWLRWEEVSWNQIWYDDELSLAFKYDFALAKELRGIGIWALGYDNGRDELWKLIEKKFTNPNSVIKDHSNLPNGFQLYQNYPNPFNPVTVISWYLAAGRHVTLKVYDLLGRKIATVVNSFQSAGNYTISFDGGNLPSGTYIYSLETAEGKLVRKMLLIK